MDISVVIPNYNGGNLLEKNIPKVYLALDNYKSGKVEVIVVDDCSEDQSKEILNKLKLKYTFLIIKSTSKNLGFSSAVNLGVSASKGEIVILLNTDVIPEKGFLQPLLDSFSDDKVFAAGCMDKSIEGNKIILRGRGLGEWKRGFLVHRRGEVNKKNTLWVSGGSGAFRKSIWQKLGGFNELYNPFYWEDIDLSYRALKSGYKVFFESKSIVVHEHEKGIIKSKYSQKKIKVISYRNQFIFAWENATDYKLQLYHILWLPYNLLKSIISWDLPFILGFINALFIFPKIIKSSIEYQKFFVKKDSEVIKNYLV